MTFTKNENQVLVYEPATDAVARALITSGVYLIDFDRPWSEWHRWKSGIRAPCYCNCRGLIAHPCERETVVDALCEAMALSGKADIILGIPTGGIPWASWIAERLRLPVGFVRKEAKGYGTGKLIEGVPVPGQKVVLIDDLIGSGETVESAAKTVETEGGEIVGVLSVVNWNFAKMRDRLSKYRVVCTTSYPQVVTALKLLGKITEEQHLELIEFYQHPQTHTWRTIQ